ncbi:MAG: polysaccharide biosynthesis tyrosine autokinase [Oscillospiraceae bacterium]|nr:polysaccharide biosynthesis tyrosine autokinase [Oscillospiraceae bacterium]
MGEKTTESNGVLELDLKRIGDRLLHRLWLIVLVSVLGAALAFSFTYYFITPLYQSSAMFYVNNSALSLGDTSLDITTGDINASKSLVDSYIVILKARTTLNDIIDYTGLPLTAGQLSSMITAASVNSTEIFEIVVTNPDPYVAEQIADAIVHLLPNRIADILQGSSARVVDTAVLATRPSSPNFTKNTVAGFVVAMLIMIAIIVLKELFDTVIRTEETVKQITRYPILTSVPNMLSSTMGGKYYSYNMKKKDKSQTAAKKKDALLGEEVSFVASEAYKLLRTKLQFSFTDDSGARVLGLSSAMAGEGKSLTAVNLAYSLSQLNKKVILIDCDMRRPTLAEKMKLRKTPGLSNWLTGQENITDLLQKCVLNEGKGVFDVITAGQTPPNPVELLSSDKMAKTLQLLRKSYDYILLDLPPVGEVSDALAVANRVDGMLLVVRQDYCNRNILMSTVSQFEFIDSKILGVIYNFATESGGAYRYRKYYRRYGRRYYGYKNSTSQKDVRKDESNQDK